MRLRNSFVLLAVVTAVTVLIGASSIAWADGLVANWRLSEASGSTSFADSSGNGNNGTLVGSDSVISMTGGSYPASPVGTGVYFNGVSGPNTYINVPYNAALSPTTDLTLSAWVYIPNTLSSSSPKEPIFSLWNPTNTSTQGASGGNECYQFGPSLISTELSFRDYLGFGGDQYFNGGSSAYPSHKYTQNQWMLLTVVFDAGPVGQNTNYMTVYENGQVWHSGQFNLNLGGDPTKLYAAESGQALQLAGGGVTSTANEWLGGLSDLGIWNVALTGPGPIDGSMAYTTLGGETGALYTTPTSSYAALSQYGVSAMNQLFTLFDGQLGTTTSVTTGYGTLTWQYVPDGTLSGTSGEPGYNAGTGQYFVQLDANGGGVETVVATTPEPATLGLLASGLVGLLAYAWRKRK